MRREVEAKRKLAKHKTDGPASFLTRQHMIIKIEKIQKKNEKLREEMKEYNLLDEYLKKENEKLKENNQRLQEEYNEASTKMKKVLRLVRYTRVIKRDSTQRRRFRCEHIRSKQLMFRQEDSIFESFRNGSILFA